MEKRLLGRTRHWSTVAIFGTAAFWEIGQAEANAALEAALAAGINHIDVAPQYGLAEERLGNWLEPHRAQMFISCKTQERDRPAAWEELQRSLQKLHTSQLDLYQLHAVGTFEDLDKAMRPGGAIEALREARDKGLTQYLGITGHGIETPAVHLAALEQFEFDTVMFPINPRLYADESYRAATERLLAACVERNVGVMVIKSVTKGAWGEQPKTYNTWYEPYDAAERIQNSVNFALSQPAVTGVASPADVRLLPLFLQAAQNFQRLTLDEQTALIEGARTEAPLFT